MWMLPRTVADGKLRALAEGRDTYLGTRYEHDHIGVPRASAG
jgi:hypothetical protein